MKRFPYIESKPVIHIVEGQIFKAEKIPLTYSQYQFFCTRIADTSFGKSLSPIERMRLGMKTLEQLDAQKDEAPKCGWWYFEDNRAEAIVEATKEPGEQYNPAFAPMLLTFAEAVLKVEDAPKVTK